MSLTVQVQTRYTHRFTDTTGWRPGSMSRLLRLIVNELSGLGLPQRENNAPPLLRLHLWPLVRSVRHPWRNLCWNAR